MRLKPNFFIISGIALCFLWLSRYFSSIGMQWYRTLQIPTISPPGWFISAIWQLIYVLTTASALIVWNTFERTTQFWLIISLFVLNIVCNIGWTYLFFCNQMIFASLIDAIVIWLSLCALIILIWPQSRVAATLLFPYIGWVSFAIYLNYLVWQIN